jgi:hypothetical protein
LTTLSGPVGLRDGVKPVLSLKSDQKKIIDLIWSIPISDGGQLDAPAETPKPGSDRQCDPTLAAAIMAFQKFWVLKGEFKKADGVVDPFGATLKKLDRLAASPTPAPKRFREVDGIRIRQTLGDASTAAHKTSADSIEPSSVMPFTVPPLGRGQKLVQTKATGEIHEFLFEIEKDGATFWIGAAVPAGTTDFTQATVFFHPATIGPEGYKTFSGRWLEVQRYVNMQGVQMAAARKRTLLVPFMPVTAKSDSPSLNMFAARGVNLINVVLAEIQIMLGRTGALDKVARLGTASFSSGVDYMTRFLKTMGSSVQIAEVIDFDSAHMVASHSRVPAMAGAAVWQVTQAAPPGGFRLGWLHLPPDAFSEVREYGPHTNGGNVHAKIGYMMFRSMMTVSVMR